MMMKSKPKFNKNNNESFKILRTRIEPESKNYTYISEELKI